MGHEHGLDGPYEAYRHQVVTAYKDIVVGQHYGHAHAAYTCAFRDVKKKGGAPGDPLHSVYIGNAVTTYSELNPGFAIFHYDRALTAPNLAHEYEEYWLDLDVANAKNSTEGCPANAAFRHDGYGAFQ